MADEHDNLATLARGADAWDARDREGWLAGFHPDVEYVAAPGPEGGVVQGREALGRLYDTWWDTWSEIIRRDFERVAAGEWALQLAELTLRGAASGLEITQPVGWLYRFEDGLVIYARLFSDSRHAREEFDHVTAGASPVIERY